MKHGSLFSGIGGFDLAAEWMGWENSFHCEWNPFGQKVLKYYWPKAISYHDITKTDFTIHRGAIDILTGGFPCQPYSVAGKRKGKEDERHLWPEMLRSIREIRPRWVVGENVRGLVSWDGGVVFEEVQADLEAEGYEVQPFILPAASVNAPHRRDRVWFVAYSNSNTERSSRESGGFKEDWSKDDLQSREWRRKTELDNRLYEFSQYASKDVKHSNSIRQEWRSDETNKKTSVRNFISESNARINQRTPWDNFPTVFPICDGNDGISDRLDNITFSKWRNESIKAGGNAIVPQVALQIFKAIEQYDSI